MFYFLRLLGSRLRLAWAACSMNFWASLEYAVGVMIGSCSVIGVVGVKYRNHYAQIVMVGISAKLFNKKDRASFQLFRCALEKRPGQNTASSHSPLRATWKPFLSPLRATWKPFRSVSSFSISSVTHLLLVLSFCSFLSSCSWAESSCRCNELFSRVSLPAASSVWAARSDRLPLRRSISSWSPRHNHSFWSRSCKMYLM